MEIVNLLHFGNRSELRQWLKENHRKEKCCWVVMYRSKCPEWPAIPYIEVVEEALCFGWIDSTLKRLPDGQLAQRLSPRRPKSHWTQLNMDRCVDLEDRGLMTEAGRQAFESSCKRVSKNKFFNRNEHSRSSRTQSGLNFVLKSALCILAEDRVFCKTKVVFKQNSKKIESNSLQKYTKHI